MKIRFIIIIIIIIIALVIGVIFMNILLRDYIYIYIYIYIRHPCSSILIEKLTDFQIVKKFSAYNGTRRFITAFTSAPILSQINPVHDNQIPLPEDPTYYYSSTYTWVSQVVSFPQVSPPKPCIRLYSPPYALHSPPMSLLSILSPKQYLVSSTVHKAPNYVVISTPLFSRPS